MTADHEKRGLLRLMLKMPALRGRLQVLSARNPEVMDLCGAFEDASATLERLQKENRPSNRDKIEEYQTICREIEDDIISICSRYSV